MNPDKVALLLLVWIKQTFPQHRCGKIEQRNKPNELTH